MKNIRHVGRQPKDHSFEMAPYTTRNSMTKVQPKRKTSKEIMKEEDNFIFTSKKDTNTLLTASENNIERTRPVRVQSEQLNDHGTNQKIQDNERVSVYFESFSIHRCLNYQHQTLSDINF